MAEENVTRYKCDRCNHIEEVQMGSGFFGGVKKGPTPPNWGQDLLKKVVLCGSCYKEYQTEYMGWFNNFMSKKKKKVE